jgi:UDP-N-acetylmuramoyl-L-alanyl-D-glutamate--2,6-diaminopimelate ligase
VGNEATDNPEHQTTPEAPVIHARLGEMLERGCEFAVLETSSHGLSRRTNRLGALSFDAAVMTNVRHEHLEFHGTWEQYRFDKANLFRQLRPGGFGVVNSEDPSAGYFRDAAGGKPVFTYGTRDADLALLSIESTGTGNTYSVRLSGDPGGLISIHDNLPGSFNAGNVLASLLVVSSLTGRPLRELVNLVPALVPVRGRMTRIDRGQDFEVLVDYAHTPSSFATIFPPLRARCKGKLISVFGSAGERDTLKRPEQGRIAAEYADIVILTDEDPRGEDPMAILQDLATGIKDATLGEKVFLIPERPSAIRKAFSLAKAGDLVLLLGKGHENSIIYGDGPHPYDEIGEAEAALRSLGLTKGEKH